VPFNDCRLRPALGVCLLHPEEITTAELATPQHGGLDPNVGTVVLSCRAQDTRILREIARGRLSSHNGRKDR
jgi:hypothetical protein